MMLPPNTIVGSRTYGPENLCSPMQKDCFDSIGPQRTSQKVPSWPDGMVNALKHIAFAPNWCGLS